MAKAAKGAQERLKAWLTTLMATSGLSGHEGPVRRLLAKQLKELGIAIVASDTGGHLGRKIIFNTGTGKIRVRLLRKTGHEINEEIDKGFSY